MLEVCSIMMKPERTNPFPRYVNFIDSAMYHDGGPLVQNLYNLAVENVNVQKESLPLPFFINTSYKKRMFIVDNFYNNPDQIRNFALTQVQYQEDLILIEQHCYYNYLLQDYLK